MLDVVNNGTSNSGADWHTVWKTSPERSSVDSEIEHIHEETRSRPSSDEGTAGSQAEFAAPFIAQLQAVSVRVFQQYWRMPSYIFAKCILGVAAGLFIGFSFYQPDATLAGMSNVLFEVFMITTIFTTLVGQVCLTFHHFPTK